MTRADAVSRTAKIFLDDGSATSLTEAEAVLARYVLQINVGAGIERSTTRQTMLATIVNTACRAFLGGVRVRIADKPDTDERVGTRGDAHAGNRATGRRGGRQP